MLTTDSCLICASRDLRKVPAELAPFLRIRCEIEEAVAPISRCYCSACDFSFFDHRLDEGEIVRLYRDYRGQAYRELRERLEPGSKSNVELNEERGNEFHRVRLGETAALFSKWGMRPCRVLDYGGGADGWLAHGLFPEAEVHAYDLSSEMLLPPQGVFDLVLCAHVLEHVSLPLPFLKELERYLVPGGYLYAEVPYDPAGPLSETLLDGHPLNRMHEHLSFFTPRSLNRLLVASGMEPIHVEGFRVAPYYRGIAALARRSDARKVSWSALDDLPPLCPPDDLCAPFLTRHLKCLDQLAKRWLATGIRAVIYPAGNFSMEILAGTCMSEAVVALGDGNPRLRGKERMGKRVYSTDEIPGLGAQILLIASPLYEEEIVKQLAWLESPDLHLLRASQVSTLESSPPPDETRSPTRSGVKEAGRWRFTMSPASHSRRQPCGTTRFVIFSHMRSGTNFLRAIINQHPRVLELGELLHSNPAVTLYPAEILGKKCFSLTDLDWFLTNAAARRGVEAIGFTLFSQAAGHVLSDSEAVQLALDDGLRVVFLRRRNLLKSFVSAKRAWLTGAWHVDAQGNLIRWSHSNTDPDALDRRIGPLDINEAKGWIDGTKKFLSGIEEALDSRSKEHCTIFYEDLCLESPSRTISEVNRLLGFLKLAPLQTFKPRYSKVASRSFYESIPNRQELVDALGYDLD